MLLKIKRSQKSSMMGNALFALDFRAEVSRRRAQADRQIQTRQDPPCTALKHFKKI